MNENRGTTENAPITAFCWTGELIYAQGRRLCNNKFSTLFDSPIKGILQNDANLLVFTKTVASLLTKKKMQIVWTKLFKVPITSAYIDTKVHILLADGVYVIIDIESSTDISKRKIFSGSIFSGFITAGIVAIGSFNRIHLFSTNDFKERSVFTYHKGRIFDIYIPTETSIISCGEDRKIKLDGKDIAYDKHNYFYRLLKNGNSISAFNRDGKLNILENGSNQKLDFGAGNLTAMMYKDKALYIGTKSGCIYTITEGIVRQISGLSMISLSQVVLYEINGSIRLFSSGVYIHDGQIVYNGIRVPISGSITDCCYYGNILYLLDCGNLHVIESGTIKHIIQYLTDDLFINLSVTETTIFLYNEHKFLYICRICFRCIKVVKLPRIHGIRDGVVFTKNGRIFINSVFFKISDYVITDVMIRNGQLFVADENGRIYTQRLDQLILAMIVEKHTCIKLDDFLIDLTETQPEIVYQETKLAIDKRQNMLYKDSQIPNKGLHAINDEVYTIEKSKDKVACGTVIFEKTNKKLKCLKIEEGCTTMLLYCDFTTTAGCNNFKMLGNEHGYIFLLMSGAITDRIKLVDSVVGIYNSLGDEASFVAYTRCGYAYSIVILNNKIYISNEIKLPHRITAATSKRVCLSNGTVLSLTPELTFSTEIQVDSYITAIVEDIFSFNGSIQHIKSNISIKISTASIFKMIKLKDFYVAVGDEHAVIAFDSNFNIIATQLAHTAQIFDVTSYGEHIFTLSSDMRICILNLDLEVVKYIKHNVKLPRIIEVINGQITIYGEWIEVIQDVMIY